MKYEEQSVDCHKVIIQPNYMALCHADQRYYQGKRDSIVLAKKLPMALIHEACGTVLFDPTNTFKIGQKVVMIPNQPPKMSDEYFYENYMEGAYFLSSGFNGFMQEFVSLPADRVVPYNDIEDKLAVLTEFVSVAMHAINRFEHVAHLRREHIAIFGDGSLAYVTAIALRYYYPEVHITVFGRNEDKLKMFNFVNNTLLTHQLLSSEIQFDHAFECCGGQGSEMAIDDIIKYINPQGTLILMGVSDSKISVNTRDILEKGLTLVGSSRSGRDDFEKAIAMMSSTRVQNLLRHIIYEFGSVKSINDIHRVFEMDLSTLFKTVFKWEV
ncbi:Alcohol dehydrogenase, zinc-containing [Bibersteinia trehalosi USDA-ARS-USMARC-190]|uniref:Alcohol dehydrogenase, zinc-containing n=1 Tax=Bibersteinia trehalosi USDA-ARS-USMARC-190 TaxID=1263832 RepID=W0R8J5_BIBTR|nr:Alcohol dehydrogenase, zinc-containing [Bibersteinia trehalosi USDA-ARS-USMARC-190]